MKIFIAVCKLNPYTPTESSKGRQNEVTSLAGSRGKLADTLTNGLSSFTLMSDALIRRQHGLSPFQQLLLLHGLSVCVRVL